MPSSIVTSASLLCTPDGWIAARAREQEFDVWGLDERGRLSVKPVKRHVLPAERVFWLGTACSFGRFAAETRVLTALGQAITLDQLVTTGTVKQHAFETCFPAERTTQTATALDMLAGSSLAWNESTLLLPEPTSDDRTAIVHHQGLATSDLVAAVLGCREVTAGVYQLDRSQVATLTMHLSFLRSHGTPYRLSYDAIQHTSQVTLDTSTVQGLPDLRGMCAFGTFTEKARVEIQWTERGWNPLCHGFILAPNT